VIAEVVSLSGYEAQVSAVLNEDERIAMEFYIACAPEDHPVIPGAGGFRKTRGTDQESGKGRTLVMGVRKVNTGTMRRTKLGMALEQSAREILAHVKGDVRLPTRRIVLPNEVDVKRIRTKAGMSQAEFARAFCLNPRTLQEWEQGRRRPDATTRAYLAVIAKNREAVLDALAS
jgi:putative transcriptional regulator